MRMLRAADALLYNSDGTSAVFAELGVGKSVAALLAAWKTTAFFGSGALVGV